MGQPAMVAQPMAMVQQPAAQQIVTTTTTTGANNKEWRHGIFGCFDDCGMCLLNWFCPEAVYGIACEGEDKSCPKCFFPGLLFFIPIFVLMVVIQRYVMVSNFGIEENCFQTFLCAVCCTECAMQQQAMEAQDRKKAKQNGQQVVTQQVVQRV